MNPAISLETYRSGSASASVIKATLIAETDLHRKTDRQTGRQSNTKG